jgi:hypothetical protein
MRAAQAAFKKGDYAKAIAQAQQALKEDPGQKDAQKLAENALNGQRAEERARRAEMALGKSDFAAALARPPPRTSWLPGTPLQHPHEPGARSPGPGRAQTPRPRSSAKPRPRAAEAAGGSVVS